MSHDFWMNQGLDLLNTSKWPSEPQFCEIWSLSCPKMARNGCKMAIYHSISFPNSLYCTWFMRVFWETFLRYQPCDNYSKQNEIAQSSDDNLLPLYGPPYHDSDIIHHTGSDFVFEFSLNPLRLFLKRETDTKMIKSKSSAICKTSIWSGWFSVTRFDHNGA